MGTLIRSFRILRKNWQLAAIAVFSLAIAMALVVICCSLANTSLLAPPAGVAPGRLVTIYLKSPGEAIGPISDPDYQYYRHHNRVFSGVAALAESVGVIRAGFGAPGQSPKPLVTVAENPVSNNYFSVLGIHPFLGRLFSPGDQRSNSRIAVMTYSCWKRLGSDRNIVGKLVGSYSIIGVTPKEFTGSLFGINGDLLLPLSASDASNQRGRRHLVLLARLKPGVTRAQAQADVTVLSRQLATAYPKEDKDRTAVVTRATLLPPDAIPGAELINAMLLTLVLLVLLIACANVANLLLAIAVGRRQEAMIKLVLGASRGRLIAEFLREAAIICTASSGLGYALAKAVIVRYSTVNINVPMLGTYSLSLKLHLGATVLLLTVALMLVAILATGLPPALYGSSRNPAHILSGEVAIGGTRKRIRRSALVVIQIAVCTLVLVGMGLCERGLYNLRQVSPGFSARNIVAQAMFPGEEGYSISQGRLLYANARRAVSGIPGVERVSLAGDLPLLGGGKALVRLPSGGKPVSVGTNTVDGNYFATFGIPVIAGRVFGSFDTPKSPNVVVVSRKMAETLWPRQNAVGNEVIAGKPSRRALVVGIVGDVRYDGLDQPAQPFMYYALSQHYESSVSLIARTKGDPSLWTKPIADAVHKVGFKSLITPITFEDVENLSLLPQRLVAGCVAFLSALGLLLAVVGLFGAVSYSVSERKKELGLRVALGAQPGQLVRMIFRETLSIAGMGTLIGIALSIAVTIVVRSQLFGIGPVEWSVLVPVAAVMLLVSLAVAYFSARPWLKVDPMEALRHS